MPTVRFNVSPSVSADEEEDEEEEEEEAIECLSMKRQMHRMKSLVNEYGVRPPPKSPIKALKDAIIKYFHSLTLVGFANAFLESMPIIRCLKEYKIRSYLLGDILAGLTVAIMHIPQGKSNMSH